MLINLRNALMAGKRLPYDAEVGFLESTGTQYINTLVNADSNLSVEITMANAGTPWKNVNPIGAILSTPLCRHHLNFEGASGYGINYYLGNGNFCNVLSGYRPSDGEVFTFKVDAISKTFTLGSFIGTFPNDTFDTGLSYWLFGRNGTTPPYLGSLRICSAKLWNGSILVRDYIPVRKGTVGYLYDRVSGALFGNAGTGDFVLGQDVVPVEYIESHGTEYIDTGIKLTPSYEYDIDFNILRNKGNTQSVSSTYNNWNQQSPLFLLGLSTYFNGRLITVGTAGLPASYGVNVGWVYGQRVAMSLRGSNITYNGTNYEFTRFEDVTEKANRNQPLFGALYPNASVEELAEMRLWHCDIWVDGATLSRKFRPVRVGTDTTSWEGAMMDTLTRRIYRNAGTGAFGYGNDLKYPIPA